MFRTPGTLRLIIAGLALALSAVTAPAAQAQSVRGKGTFYVTGNGAPTTFKVNVTVHQDGSVQGTVSLRHANSWFPSPAVSLVVAGNVATVTTTTGWTFAFTDNGDVGDCIASNGFLGGLSSCWALLSGGVTVIP